MQVHLKALALLGEDLELEARERQYQERYYRLGLELGLDYPALVAGLPVAGLAQTRWLYYLSFAVRVVGE